MSNSLWIAIPSGFEVDGAVLVLRVSVAIVPRLEEASIGESAMAVWPPAALDHGTIEVEFSDAPGGAVKSRSVAPVKSWDRAHWQRLFPADLAIEPLPDTAGEARPLRVRSTSADAVAAERIFVTVAAAQVASNGGGDDVPATVNQALHDNPFEPEEEVPPLGPPPVAADAPPEFHKRFSMLREHPTILRALGLVLDLRVPADGLAVGGSGVIRVRWVDAPAGTPAIVSPWTAFELAADRFLPSSSARITSGLVSLSDAAVGSPADAEAPGWRVTTLNVDVAASRLREAAAKLAVPHEPSSPALPALATGGLSLLRVGRQQEMDTARQNRRQRGVPTEETVLDADDVTLGFRLDVRRGGADWQSLFLREASYFAGDGTPLNETNQLEEGHLKPASALDYGDNVLRTDEMVARWSGWSLAVGRPTFDGGVDRLSRERRADLPLHFEFQPPKGSLPRLRFASSYVLRLRVADLAGGGLELADPAADRLFTRPITFRRFEPVGAPDVVLSPDVSLDRLGPGESVFDIVIRSDRGMSAAAFAAANEEYRSALGRILSQPQASLDFAERHQMLDTLSSEASWDIIRDAVSDPDPDKRTPLPDPAAGSIAAFLPASQFGPEVLQIRNWPDWPKSAPKTLEVRDGSAGGAVSMAWSGENLIVSPKQAQSITLELSSPVRDDFLDHFSAKPFLGVSEDAAMSGRHPILTPRRFVRITHAVRKPLKDPGGTLTPHRLPGQAYAILNPGAALIGADAPSTAKIEITAAWTEHADDAENATTGAPVELLSLTPDADALPHDIRHEFGDTRHRRVTYTVTAVSRFRHLFFQDETDRLFIAQGKIADVSIPNAARPAPPTLLNAYPAFRWTDLSDGAGDNVIARRKREACVRVELERPWFMTGEGEQIAVILPEVRPPSAAQATLFTELGRDPVWGTASPDRWPLPDQFSLQAGSPDTIDLPEAGTSVIAVPHGVWFDRGRWFADIALPEPASATYTPLARFALARYQRESLPGLSLSSVIRTGFVPLLPERTLTVSRSADGFTVQLAGLAGTHPSAKLVQVALETNSEAGAPLTGPTATGADDFGAWRQIGTASGALNEDIVIGNAGGTVALRLRIREIAGSGFESGVVEDGLDELSSQTRFVDIINLEG
jgi:hypothetical protein